jgi:hypothetical protein
MPTTSGRSGSAASSISMPVPAACAISFRAEASPPRVASRAARMSGAAAIAASIRCPSAWQSERMSLDRARSPRAARMVAP